MRHGEEAVLTCLVSCKASAGVPEQTLPPVLLSVQRPTKALSLAPLPFAAMTAVYSGSGPARRPGPASCPGPCSLPGRMIRLLTRAPSDTHPQPAHERAQEPALLQHGERPSGPAALSVLAAAHCCLRCTGQAAEAAPMQAAWSPGAAAVPALPGPSARLLRWAVRGGPGPRRRATGLPRPAGTPLAPCSQHACSAAARPPGCASRQQKVRGFALLFSQHPEHCLGTLRLRPS